MPNNGMMDFVKGFSGYENAAADDWDIRNNENMFDILKKKRQRKQVKEDMGAPSEYGPYVEGLQSAGTGIFTGLDPDTAARLEASALMANTNDIYGSAYTGLAGNPEDVVAARNKAAADLHESQQGRLGTMIDRREDDEKVSDRVIGFDATGMPIVEEAGRGQAFGSQFQSERGKLQDTTDHDYYTGLQTDADKKADTALNYRYINRIADQAGIKTGFGDEAILMGQKIAGRMGLEGWEGETGAREAVLQAYNSATLDLMKPGEDGKRALAGQSSDKELDFFKQIPPGLGKTRAGRELIALVASENAKRASEVATASIPYRRKGIPSYDFQEMIRKEKYADRDLDARWEELLGEHKAEVGEESWANTVPPEVKRPNELMKKYLK